VGILKKEHPMTIRQLFYRLVSGHIIENCSRDYHRVIRLMTRARKDGRVDYDWIVDRSRASYKRHLWRDMNELADAFEDCLASYRSDWWQDQDCYVEVWSEKDTVTGSIKSVMDEFGLRADTNKGFTSTSTIHTAA